MKSWVPTMSCCEERPRKSMKSWAPTIHLNVGFVASVLFMLLIYLVVSQQTAISGLSAENGEVVLNTKGYYSETCEVHGDVRVNGTALSVALVPSSRSERREWRIQPYSRKTLPGIKAVTVAHLPDRAATPACTARYSAPAVLFAVGGLTGNFWHDFTDVLVPLFVASRQYGGEVQLLITNAQPWWPAAYGPILRRLSRYDVVDLDGDEHVRCFPHVTVGIHMHKDLSIIPEWVPGRRRLSMPDFTRFLREIYALPRGAPVSLAREPGKRPRLLLIRRGHSRRFMNEQEILRAAEAAGFEAAAIDLRRDVGVEAQARAMNSHDVLLGVHGAGLTNMLFLPPGGVLIQVVPYGKIEHIARMEYGEPAKDMGLRYLEHSVATAESTLLETLGPEHPAIKDPDAVHRSGWNNMTEFYLNRQSVRVDVARFAPTLAKAFDHLHQQ
ncbi:hypothetical protein C2845_PM07G02290 [Panicum miliaceum]|uniref:Glycosyltransferase 61 catalytic domain-containing protein n=1 Tax=Panicum miliaceum TaxID=4540 RepID=A0A3L6SNC3_PANMI|nr:hypothetical protein C2845_PM07G02290 [Panicum miliaceum]